MKNKMHKKFYYLSMFTLVFSGVAILYFSIFLSLPYSWYVDIKVLEAHDVCVGSNIINIYTERYPRWGILGQSYGEIVRFDDVFIYETTIKRGRVDQQISFGYEENTEKVYFQTDWSEPFVEVGEYGINSWNTIYPLPFITVKEFTRAEDNRFKVVECSE